MNKTASKILILGATGMLGYTLFTHFSEKREGDVYATVRDRNGLSEFFSSELLENLTDQVDAHNFESVESAILKIKPDVVINCIGIIKQLPEAKDAAKSNAINSLFPRKLASTCKSLGIRAVHISTDCVFSGNRGNYTEEDQPDATDIYGQSKSAGEISNPGCITLRTSIIGHEIRGQHGLVEWFLSQTETVSGYAKAIFTGFPTIEFADIILDYVIPNAGLSGLYHVSSDPISKYELLQLVAKQYGKEISIEKDETVHCDRSLNSDRFQKATGYKAPSWSELVKKMYSHAQTNQLIRR